MRACSFGDLGYQVLGDSLPEHAMYHVIEGLVYDIELLTIYSSYGNFTLGTSQGENIVVSSVADSTGAVTIMVNNASILFSIETTNGVVHLIDEVLTFPVYGCMDEGACNYDSDATEDDGSCLAFNVCGGCEGRTVLSWCTDVMACNYDPGATLDSGMCAYPEQFYDCDGNCLSDSDGDGVCDELEAPGCTLEFACNYEPTADEDDGSCEFVCPGCTDEAACNYDPSALQDNGSCLTLDECGVCGGEGIPEGNCDCEGNVLDALGECGGISEQEFELCLGNNEYQIFSFCAGDDGVNTINFTGGFLETCCDFIAVYDGADATAPLIAVTNGDLTGQSFSSTNAEACITIELTSDGSVSCATGSFDPLTYIVSTGDFCFFDDDSDGICDNVDDCVGQYDECGVCNGPGAVFECGCSGPEEGIVTVMAMCSTSVENVEVRICHSFPLIR